MAAIVGAALAAVVGLLLHTYPFGLGLTHLSYDLLGVASGDQRADDVVLVFLDEQSHLALDQSFTAAWDRGLHAQLIQRLTESGARAIVFDIVFSDPNPDDPDGDQALADAMQANGATVLAADRIIVGPGQSQAIPPFGLLLNAAASIGSAEVIPDSDLVVREHTPEEELPSLAAAAAEIVDITPAQSSRLHGKRWMKYYGPPNWLTSVSYADALNPEKTSEAVFRDKVVFVGARIMTKFAGDRKDEYRNPFSHLLSSKMAEQQGGMFITGVEIQATAFLNLLRNDWLTRLPMATEQICLILAGLIAGCGLILFRPLTASLVTIGSLIVLAVGTFALFRMKLIWFPWLLIVVQVMVALGWSVLFNSVQLYVQKRLFEHTLSLYLSPKLVKKFSKDPALLKPGAEKQLLTLFFSDIEDFTKLSEGMDSDELAFLMNAYFESAVAECIHKTDGTVVKYIGDAIFAFWSAPELQADHAVRACEAVLRFREVSSHSINGITLRTRIGLHTGVANVGNFGSSERVDYTALGESVNLASRMEGLNKFLKTTCLMTGDTKATVGDQMVTRGLGRFRLKGFKKAVEVHELVGWPDDEAASKEWRETFEGALKAYLGQDFKAAAKGFRRTIELRSSDGPSSFYLQHMLQLQREALPQNWSGEIELTEK